MIVLGGALGIDVSQVSLLVSYDMPTTFDEYMRRRGLAAHLGNGRAAYIYLCSTKNMRMVGCCTQLRIRSIHVSRRRLWFFTAVYSHNIIHERHE